MLSLLTRFSVLNRPTKSVCGFRFILAFALNSPITFNKQFRGTEATHVKGHKLIFTNMEIQILWDDFSDSGVINSRLAILYITM